MDSSAVHRAQLQKEQRRMLLPLLPALPSPCPRVGAEMEGGHGGARGPRRARRWCLKGARRDGATARVVLASQLLASAIVRKRDRALGRRS